MICTRSCLRYFSLYKMNPIEKAIYSQLKTIFNPVHLSVINESYMHNVPKGSETHFKVVVVSDQFDSLPLIKRHRLVNEALKEQLQHDVHALSIVTKTSVEWENCNQEVAKSPPCMGGFGK